MDSIAIYKGQVVHYNNDRGFGFLYSYDHQSRYFFHIRQVNGGLIPGKDQLCTFQLRPDNRGRPDAAVNVHLLPEFATGMETGVVTMLNTPITTTVLNDGTTVTKAVL